MTDKAVHRITQRIQCDLRVVVNHCDKDANISEWKDVQLYVVSDMDEAAVLLGHHDALKQRGLNIINLFVAKNKATALQSRAVPGLPDGAQRRQRGSGAYNGTCNNLGGANASCLGALGN